MRLISIAKEFNVSFQTIADYLKYSYGIDNLHPMSQVSEKLYDSLKKEFNTQKNNVISDSHFEIKSIEGFLLPDGSIYNGEGIKHGVFIELCGQGEILYPNGDKYKGAFKYGRPFGWGKYILKNGYTHKGFFDNMPNGLVFCKG